MLPQVLSQTTGRRLRLLVCAACRRVPAVVVSPQARQAVEMGEAVADGWSDYHQRGALLDALHPRWTGGLPPELAPPVAAAVTGCIDVGPEEGLPGFPLL